MKNMTSEGYDKLVLRKVIKKDDVDNENNNKIYGKMNNLMGE